MEEVLLRVEGVTKRFPGVLALDQARLEVRAGEVHGLIGENGAGKSTLVNVLAGSLVPDSGRIIWKGRPVRFQTPVDAQRAGIRTVFQHLSLVPVLTVADNLFLGRELQQYGLLHRREMLARAARVLALLGEAVNPATLVRHLTPQQRYLVEIAKAILEPFDLLILDEPTACLTAREADRLFGLVREWVTQGKSVIWITHRLEELQAIADRVTVMRDGKYVTTVQVRDVSRNDLIRLMTGKEFQEVFPPLIPVQEGAAPVMEVDDLSTAGGLAGVSFSLRPGEVLGVGGLIGSGKSELGRALVGLETVTSGRIRLFGHVVPIRALSPRWMLDRGVMYFPADRRGEGIVLCRSVLENMTLSALERFSRGWLLRKQEEASRGADMVRRFDITPPLPGMRIRYLSGGNQQKVLLARGLLRPTHIFILDEPTQGIDVGAKIAIYRFIQELTRSGAAVLLISSDMMELINLCHRVLVLHRGRVTAVLSRDEVTEERLLRHYFGEVGERVYDGTV